MNRITLLLITGIISLSCSSSKDKPETNRLEDQSIIKVDANMVMISRESNPIGINLNYLRDADVLRGADAVTLRDALKNFNGNWLRYPGGKKSNYYRFALPPYYEVNPQTSGWYVTERKEDVLDFDEYVTLAADVDANMYVVVAYDKERINDQTTTLQEYIDHAVGWVKYAQSKGSNVKYWEVGNENWNNFAGSSWQDVIKDVASIAKAMKNADPSIKVGTNFGNEGQLNELLKEAGADLDFISCSNYYPGTEWGNIGYKFYEERMNVGMLFAYETFVKATKDLDLDLEFIIAETNSKEWEGTWTDNNDIGHALVCFDICAQINLSPEITTGMFWNTSWFDTENNAFNLFTGKNELRSNARSVKLWNDFWKPQAVKIESVSGLVTYALKNNSGALTLFIIIKTRVDKKAAVEIEAAYSYAQNKVYCFSGRSGQDSDIDTELKESGSINFVNNRSDDVSFPAYSITVIDLK